jgi:aminoglycoside phosphotransferase (APT) family kinase protein
MNRFDRLLNHMTTQRVFCRITRAEEITSGGSGATLLDVTDDNGRYVVKTTFNAPYIHEERLKSYKREYDFYGVCRKQRIPFAPEIIHLEQHDDFGIIVVMTYAGPVRRDEWDMDRQLQAVDLCARLASLDIHLLRDMPMAFREMKIDPEFSRHSYREWLSVVRQHHGRLDETNIARIYENLDMICPILNAKPHHVCHGDFHPNNILSDGEHLVICDWQNINIGKCAADFSFFLKRGFNFGIDQNNDALFEHYANQLSLHAREPIDRSTLWKETCAATVHNSFLFWPHPLKNAGFERVKSIYDGMVRAFGELS